MATKSKSRPSPADLAALRLQLSEGEIRCPRKGTLAIARCLSLQEETTAEGAACTCSVYRQHAGVAEPPQREPDAPAPIPPVRLVRAPRAAPPPPPPAIAETIAPAIAETPAPIAAPPPGGFARWREKKLHEAGAEVPPAIRTAAATERTVARLAAEEGRAPPVEEEPTPAPTASAKNGGRDAIRAALAAEPERVFSVAELALIKGGSRKALSVSLTAMRQAEQIEHAGVARWRAGPQLRAATPAAAKEIPMGTNARKGTDCKACGEAGTLTRRVFGGYHKDCRPAKGSAPAAAPETPADGDLLRVARKLRWAIQGCQAGHVTIAELGAIAEAAEVRRVLG